MQGTGFFNANEQLNTASGLVVAGLLYFVGVFVILITHHRETLSDQFRLFSVAYLTRLAMIVLIYNAGLIEIVTDADSHGWRHSLTQYDAWKSEGYGSLTALFAMYRDLPSLRTGVSHIFHIYSYSVLFLMTGLPGRISAASLNALFGALIPIFAFRMSIQVFGDLKAARYLGWVLAMMPSLLVFSAMTAKEPFVVFFEVLGLYSCIQFAQRRFRIRYFATFVLSAFSLTYLRFYVYYVLLGTFLISIIVPSFIRGRMRNALVTMGLMLTPFIMFVGYKSAISEREEDTARASILVATGELKTYGSRMGGKSFVENPFDISQPSQFLPGLIFGLAHLMYAPFPWNLARGSLLMLMTSPEVIWWYHAGTVRLFRGLRYGLRANLADALIPILFCLPLIYYYSLIFSNIGLAYRYRAQIYPELILFIGLGYKRLKPKHGYQSYELPGPDEPEEFMAEEMSYGNRNPWTVHERFEGAPGYRTHPWHDRDGGFGRR